MSFFLLSLLVCIGCQKIKDHEDACRLVSQTSEFGDQTYTYNQWGLLDQYNLSNYDGYFKMEYNASGRLVKSRYYSEGALVNTIFFYYQTDRVVQETWYDGDTQTKTDEIFYTFNSDGMVSTSQSLIQDYNTIYKYTPDGSNVATWSLYSGGILGYTQQFTFIPPHHKDPFLATPGLDYGFPFINGGTTQSKWYSTSEKDISYDENGMNPQVVLDQDPYKSIIQSNRHNYVTVTDFFDNLTQEYVHFRFEYENCGNDVGDNTNSSQKSSVINSGKISPLHLLKMGSAKTIKEQLKELRQQYLKLN